MNGKGKGVFKIIKLRNYKIISFCIDKHFNSNIIVVIQVQFSLKVNSVKTKLVKYLSSNISLKKKGQRKSGLDLGLPRAEQTPNSLDEN